MLAASAEGDDGGTHPAPAAGVERRGDVPLRIGDYEIIEELGRGGMARVFAARQAGLGRVVALKAIPAGRGTADIELRFLREVQTVARLKHPHVVAVHASGRADGFVYYSMEYVDGGDLGRRLRERPFAPRDAAILLQKVAGALAYTHGAGVLHRDLKPSNILLDGDEPKVADFGLAAQLEAGGDLTMATSLLGTPHYVAPEALHGGSAALSIASDIYALGVILFEMLTGRTPYAGASPAELPLWLEQHDVPTPRALAPVVPRDLETICLQCLEREPSRRYHGAAALAEDLRRFLNGESILARAPGKWDRLAKFARRRRALVLSAAAISAVLVAATTASSVLAVRARRAERAAADEAETSRALARFLQQDLLFQASPDAQPDRNVTLHTVLDRAGQKIDGRFVERPMVEADLRDVIGRVYETLGDYPAAEKHLARAMALRRAYVGPDDPRTVAVMYELAGAFLDQAKYPKADELSRQAFAIRRRILGPDAPETLDAALLRAAVLREFGKVGQAEALLVDTVRRGRLVYPATDDRLANAIDSLGGIRFRQSRFVEAEACFREAADLEQRSGRADGRVSLTALNDLAMAYRQQNKLREAEPILVRVLEYRRRTLGPEHPHTVITINNLGSLYKAEGRYADAEPLQREAYAIAARVLGPEHPQAIVYEHNVADTCRLAGRFAEAETIVKEVVAKSRRVSGNGHVNTVGALVLEGDILVREGKAADAERVLREALGTEEENEPDGWRTHVTRAELGAALAQLRRFDEAEPLLLRGYEDLLKDGGRVSSGYAPLVAETGERIVAMYTSWGRADRAAEWRAKIDGVK